MALEIWIAEMNKDLKVKGFEALGQNIGPRALFSHFIGTVVVRGRIHCTMCILGSTMAQ